MKLIRCLICLLLYDIERHKCCPNCNKELQR